MSAITDNKADFKKHFYFKTNSFHEGFFYGFIH